MEKQPLTSRQREILECMMLFTRENGYPPTVREVCRVTGLRSPRSVSQHLQALERKGYIEKGKDKSRAIRFLDDTIVNADDNIVSMPVVGNGSSARPAAAGESNTTSYSVDRGLFDGDKKFMLKVDGESMVNAHIMEGDLVVVDPEPPAADGDVVAARIDGEATVKRYRAQNGNAYLMSDNPGMAPIDLSTHSREVLILGKVVGLIRKMN